MLTLDTQPISLTFARNPVLFRFLSTDEDGNLYAAQGASDFIVVGSVTKLATGTTITLSWVQPDGTSDTVTFTAVASPSTSTQIPDDTYSGSATEYWRAVASRIQAHPRVHPHLKVVRMPSGGGSKLVATARSTTESWEVEWSCSVGFTNGPTAPTADTTPINYRVILEVMVEKTYGTGDFRLLGQLDGMPDQEGYLWFDLSSILETDARGTRPEPKVPAWDTTEPVLCDNLRRYYVRYTEEYGDPLAVQDWQYGDIARVLDGGVSQRAFSLSDVLAGLSASDCFLTWMPDGRRIGQDDPEYLPWYNHTGTTQQAVLQVIAYDVDTGTAGATQYAYTTDPIDVEAGQTLLIPVRPSTLETELGAAFAADRYKLVVRVVEAGTEGGTPTYLSPSRTYYIDREYYESSRWLQYINGFGCPEYWRCTGTYSHRLNVTRRIGTRVLLPGADEFATDSFQYGADSEPVLEYRTGFLRKGEAEVLQELLTAADVYDVSADGYIPIRLTGDRFAVTETRQSLHAYSLEAVARLTMRNYSKVRVLAGDANAWQEPGGASWFDTVLVAWKLP